MQADQKRSALHVLRRELFPLLVRKRYDAGLTRNNCAGSLLVSRKQTRTEARPIFYSENTFVVTRVYNEPLTGSSGILSWLASLSQKKRSLIKNVRIDYLCRGGYGEKPEIQQLIRDNERPGSYCAEWWADLAKEDLLSIAMTGTSLDKVFTPSQSSHRRLGRLFISGCKVSVSSEPERR